MNKKLVNPDLMLLATALLWGSGFVATEYAIRANMNFMLIMVARFTVATLVLLIFTIKEIEEIKKQEWIRGSIAGIILFAGFSFQTLGQSMTTVSNSAFITATNVIMVPFVVWIFRKRQPKLKTMLLACMTLLGVSILTLSPNEGISFNIGDIYIFICAILFAMHISYLEFGVSGSNAKRITFIQLLVATFLSIISLLVVKQDFSIIDYHAAIPASIYMGVFSTCIAFFLQTSAQKQVSASKVGIILSMESLFGTIMAIMLGVELLSLKVAVGGTIILLAVILTELKISNRRKVFE